MKGRATSDPILSFASQGEWADWLEKNHQKQSALWLRLAKKASNLPSITYAEALEVALCYGWIDGQKRAESEQAWLQRFLPRSARSIWSKINREKVQALIASGKMKSAGLAAVDVSRKSGTWDAAYDSPKSARIPEDFQAALGANRKASDFFGCLDGANRYAILFRIQMAKKVETRARKIAEFVRMLERGERIHEPRRQRKSSK